MHRACQCPPPMWHFDWQVMPKLTRSLIMTLGARWCFSMLKGGARIDKIIVARGHSTQSMCATGKLSERERVLALAHSLYERKSAYEKVGRALIGSIWKGLNTANDPHFPGYKIRWFYNLAGLSTEMFKVKQEYITLSLKVNTQDLCWSNWWIQCAFRYTCLIWVKQEKQAEKQQKKTDTVYNIFPEVEKRLISWYLSPAVLTVSHPVKYVMSVWPSLSIYFVRSLDNKNVGGYSKFLKVGPS